MDPYENIDSLKATRDEILRDMKRIEQMMESAAEFGLHDPRGYLEDAKSAFAEELVAVNDAISRAVEKETEEKANALLFTRP